jgi:predicted nucleic acid-binding protein
MRTFVDAAVFVRTRDEHAQSREMRAAALWFFQETDRELVTSALVLGQVYAAFTGGKQKRSDAFKRADQAAREIIADALPMAVAPFDAAALTDVLSILATRDMALWDATNWASARSAACAAYASFDRPGLPHKVGAVDFVNPLELWRAAGSPPPA